MCEPIVEYVLPEGGYVRLLPAAGAGAGGEGAVGLHQPLRLTNIMVWS